MSSQRLDFFFFFLYILRIWEIIDATQHVNSRLMGCGPTGNRVSSWQSDLKSISVYFVRRRSENPCHWCHGYCHKVIIQGNTYLPDGFRGANKHRAHPSSRRFQDTSRSPTATPTVGVNPLSAFLLGNKMHINPEHRTYTRQLARLLKCSNKARALKLILRFRDAPWSAVSGLLGAD